MPAATSATILGMWKPSGPHGQTMLGFVKFNPNGTWAGSDGCNAFNGNYQLGESGAITAASGPSTLIGCDNWSGPAWVSQAARVSVSGAKLTLFDRTGHRLGAMVKLGAKSR